MLVQVFNDKGQLLTTLLNSVVAAGTYTMDCDLGDLAPGVYYARLQNEGHQQVRNMLRCARDPVTERMNGMAWTTLCSVLIKIHKHSYQIVPCSA